MRCSLCQSENGVGAASCETCGFPLGRANAPDLGLDDVDAYLQSLDTRIDQQISGVMRSALGGLSGIDGDLTNDLQSEQNLFVEFEREDERTARSHNRRGLIHDVEICNALFPSSELIQQSAVFVFQSAHVTSNELYSARVSRIQFTFDEGDPTVNAFARDSENRPEILFCAGLARVYSVVSLGVALHMQRTQQGLMSQHLPILFEAVGRHIAKEAFTTDAAVQIFKSILRPEIPEGDERFISRARSLRAAMEMTVIAHEVGHIALGHTLGRDQNYDISRNQEREADSFAASCLSSSPFRQELFLGQVFHNLIFCWGDSGGEVSTHPHSRERFYAAFESNSSAAKEAAEEYGLMKAEIEKFLPAPK